MKIASRRAGIFAAVTWLATLVPGAQAATLSLLPTSTTVTAGSTFSIDVAISGLGVAGAPSLSAFDLEVLFDPTILSASGVSFGDPILGDQLDLLGFGPFTDSDLTTAGVVAMTELSFDPALTLDTLQEPAFVLATISFAASAATAPGSPTIVSIGPSPGSLLGLPALVIDSLGDPLDSIGVEPSEITIEPAAVPVTGTLALVLLGLVGCVASKRRSPQRPA